MAPLRCAGLAVELTIKRLLLRNGDGARRNMAGAESVAMRAGQQNRIFGHQHVARIQRACAHVRLKVHGDGGE